MPMKRLGMSIPFEEVKLKEQVDMYRELQSLGYSDLWTGEVDAADAFTPLAMVATVAPGTYIGTAVVPVQTRGPALLAMQAATLGELAPGRFTLGIGSSSRVIVERWNASDSSSPLARVRDTVRFLKRAFTGEKIDEKYETFEIGGFRLGRKLEQPGRVVTQPGSVHSSGTAPESFSGDP